MFRIVVFISLLFFSQNFLFSDDLIFVYNNYFADANTFNLGLALDVNSNNETILISLSKNFEQVDTSTYTFSYHKIHRLDSDGKLLKSSDIYGGGAERNDIFVEDNNHFITLTGSMGVFKITEYDENFEVTSENKFVSEGKYLFHKIMNNREFIAVKQESVHIYDSLFLYFIHVETYNNKFELLKDTVLVTQTYGIDRIDSYKIKNSYDSDLIHISKADSNNVSTVIKLSDSFFHKYWLTFYDCVVEDVLELNDTTMIICGYSEINNSKYGFIKKMNPYTKKLSWSSSSEDDNTTYSFIEKLANNKYVVFGNWEQQLGYQIFDSLGNKSEHFLIEEKFGSFRDIVKTPDGGFLLTGDIDYQDIPYTYIVKFQEQNMDMREESEFKNNMYISPNPATDYIEINTDKIIDEIEVIDVFGRRVLKTSKQQNRIDVSSLPLGVYFVNVMIGDKVERMKFVKID
ncbi:MAG: T9SS type A sorting domain-containing protein [bacterium]